MNRCILQSFNTSDGLSIEKKEISESLINTVTIRIKVKRYK